ncbi:hypothetical protein IMZ48_46840 [Candidatus Bathyarchaeota archaeon]|nr:hypothetical protein [Candidatus Bathyarchaeota archaeon]
MEPPKSVRPSEASAGSKDATTSSTTSSEATPSSAGEADVKVRVQGADEKPSREEARRIASETVAEDLHQWESKFATAAEEGAADIEDKVNDISAAMFKSGVQKEGKTLMRELEGVVEGEVESLREQIISLVESSASGDAEEAKEAATSAVRAAGLAIKQKAEEIRSWREEFEQKLQATVTSKAQEHFNILGSMRDLALQKLGMKWAWMDGVTYKDWAKYHAMKNKFDEWTKELQELIVSNHNLEKAMNGAADVEDQAMEIAQAAAVQLGELKQVATWKIDAGDVTDNFDAAEMERAAEAAQAAQAAAEDSKNAAENQTNEAHAESEPVASDGSSTEGDEEVHADTAPEVEPEEEPEPVEDEGADADQGVHGDVDDNPPEPAEAEPDLNEEKEVPVAEDLPISETPEADEAPASKPADSETEPSVEPAEEVEAYVQDQEDTASKDSNDAVQDEPAHVILGAEAQIVLPEDTPTAAVEAAEVVYSNVLSEASAQLSNAMADISEQVDATPGLDAEDLASSASSAFSGSVESADAELSSAVEELESVLGGEEEAGVAEEKPIVEEEPVAGILAADEKEEMVEIDTAVADEEEPISGETPAAGEEEPEAVEPEQPSQDEGAQEASGEEESPVGPDDAAATQETNEHEL